MKNGTKRNVLGPNQLICINAMVLNTMVYKYFYNGVQILRPVNAISPGIRFC